MAIDEEAQQEKKGPSLVLQLAMLGVMTIAAMGTGWLSGAYLKSESAPADMPKVEKKTAAHGSSAKEELPNPKLVDLAPITTNLAAPADVWVRLEASLVYDEPPIPEMSEEIHQDMLAYLRTLKMHQIEGASGYQHLREDLNERAAIRSGGHVKDVLIRTLLFE